MKKFAVALVSALALSGLTAGAARAQCPAVAPSGKDTTGIPAGGPVEVNPDALSVYGAVGNLGYGESDFGTSGTNVTYSGELAGTVGHGEIENGSVGTDGVSGSADGQAAGLASGSGSANVSTADQSVSAGGTSVPCTTVNP
jgi:hypothetical protein